MSSKQGAAVTGIMRDGMLGTARIAAGMALRTRKA